MCRYMRDGTTFSDTLAHDRSGRQWLNSVPVPDIGNGKFLLSLISRWSLVPFCGSCAAEIGTVSSMVHGLVQLGSGHGRSSVDYGISQVKRCKLTETSTAAMIFSMASLSNPDYNIETSNFPRYISSGPCRDRIPLSIFPRNPVTLILLLPELLS